MLEILKSRETELQEQYDEYSVIIAKTQHQLMLAQETLMKVHGGLAEVKSLIQKLEQMAIIS